MTTPRTVAGRAWASGMRPHLKRAVEQTVISIETEAIGPYEAALREAERVLESLAGLDAEATWDRAARVDLVSRAATARRALEPLLAVADTDHPA